MKRIELKQNSELLSSWEEGKKIKSIYFHLDVKQSYSLKSNILCLHTVEFPLRFLYKEI